MSHLTWCKGPVPSQLGGLSPETDRDASGLTSLESLLSLGCLRKKPQYFNPYDFYDCNYYYYFVNI